MKRRTLLQTIAGAGATAVAGCSESSSETSEKSTETGLPNPEDRNYRGIHDGEDLPQSIGSRAAATEEALDQMAFIEFSEELERSASYLDVNYEGQATISQSANGESVEQDQYGFDIVLEAGELEEDQAESIAVNAFEEFIPYVRQELSHLDEDTLVDEDVISDVSLSIEAENGSGHVSYGHPMRSPEGQTTGDLKDASMQYLEEGETSTAIEEEVSEDFHYSLE